MTDSFRFDDPFYIDILVQGNKISFVGKTTYQEEVHTNGGVYILLQGDVKLESLEVIALP